MYILYIYNILIYIVVLITGGLVFIVTYQYYGINKAQKKSTQTL